ncbi:MAG: RAMP superfamily CRISPR-associated protein, partial [Saprospiraceae bacterium]
MQQYKFTLKTKSMLLTGSGEGATLIHADVVFHKSGFPFIPARRIKGMLSESLEEVMEILGHTETKIEETKQSLFGKPGEKSVEGKLIVSNLYVPNWLAIKKELATKFHGKKAFQPESIRKYYTSEIQQTAINADTEIAKKGSLRNYRVINPGICFEGVIKLRDGWEENEEDLFKKAVNHFRYCGTRRNRGFGKVKCFLGSPVNWNINQPTNTTNLMPEAVL